jgi:broad specificity phosphatase PhoE
MPAILLRLLFLMLATAMLAGCARVEERPDSEESGVVTALGDEEPVGLLLYLRHTKTDRSREDSTMFNLADRSGQRLLSPEGEAQARELRAFLMQEGWTPDLVMTSPWDRCMRTAELTFGLPVRVEHRLATFYRMSEEVKARRMTWFRSVLRGEQVRGVHRLAIVGHSDFLTDIGIEAVEEGEGVLITRGSGGEDHVVTARLRRDPWRFELP